MELLGTKTISIDSVNVGGWFILPCTTTSVPRLLGVQVLRSSPVATYVANFVDDSFRWRVASN